MIHLTMTVRTDSSFEIFTVFNLLLSDKNAIIAESVVQSAVRLFYSNGSYTR